MRDPVIPVDCLPLIGCNLLVVGPHSALAPRPWSLVMTSRNTMLLPLGLRPEGLVCT